MNNVMVKIVGIFLSATRMHYLLLICSWLLAVSSRVYLNGISYGFDYSVFQPDGVNYTLRTLMFLGRDPLTSASMIESWYVLYGGSGNHFDPSSILPANNPVWGLSVPRVLYPLLSMPFVALLGISGMLVIPSLSLLMLVICVYKLSNIYLKPGLGFILGMSLLLSPTVLRWMVANITDSLFVGLFAIICLILESKKSGNLTSLQLSILIVLTNATRFATPIWLAIALSDFMRGRRKRAILIAVFALVASIPTFLVQPSSSILPGEGDLNLVEKLKAMPLSLAKILFIEIGQLAVVDRLLLFMIAISFFLAISNLRNDTNLRFILVLLSVWAIGALNGSLGVNFRYQLPVLPFACAVIVVNSKVLENRLLRGFGDIKRKET